MAVVLILLVLRLAGGMRRVGSAPPRSAAVDHVCSVPGGCGVRRLLWSMAGGVACRSFDPDLRPAAGSPASGSVLLLAVAVILSPGFNGVWLSSAIWLVWLIWDWFPALYGGADARILIALALLALDGRIVLVLLVGMGLVGLILKVWKGRPTPMVPGILVGGIVTIWCFFMLLGSPYSKERR